MVKPVSVRNQYRRERVNLQPYGNTISVETREDNPFTAAQDVEVTTQAVTGMAGPDAAMRSRPVARHPTQGTVLSSTDPIRRATPGRVKATRFVAPAHRPHGGFVPGLGDAQDQLNATMSVMPQQGATVPTAATTSPSTWNAIIGAAGQAAGAASNILTSRYNSDAEKARAAQAAEQAKSEAFRTERTRIDSMLANAGSHNTLMFGLLGVCALALVGAFLLKGRKKGKR